MSVKTLRNQLLAAIAMTLVAAIALGSSTFAWFSLNSTVTVTGMAVKTEVNNNLLIAPTTTNGTDAVAENLFKTSLVENLNDTLLQPTSTIDGKWYFYTDKSNVMGSGNHINSKFTAYNANTGAVPDNDASSVQSFRTNAGYDANASVYGFIDYAFVLKAHNTSASAVPIQVTGLNLVYGNDQNTSIATPIEKAFRIAFLVEDVTTDNSANGIGNTQHGSVGVPGNLQTILLSNLVISDPDETQDKNPERYFTNGEAVNSVSTTAAIANYANSSTYSTGELASAGSALGNQATIAKVPANTIKYYKVVVRLWLEGEDKSCNNTTFAKLTDKWALDVKIELDPKEGNNPKLGVTAFTATDTAAKVNIPVTTILGSAHNIDGDNYYPIGDLTLGTEKLYANANSLTTTTRVFVDRNGHPIEVTNQVKLTATVTVSNSAVITPNTATLNAAYTAVITGAPTVTGVKMGGAALTLDSGYTYDTGTGTITIPNVTGAIEITVS